MCLVNELIEKMVTNSQIFIACIQTINYFISLLFISDHLLIYFTNLKNFITQCVEPFVK